MNLYLVYSCESEWGCYCFAHSANKAKMLVSYEMDDEYINMRYKTLYRGANVPFEVVVLDDEQSEYQYVKQCGFKYEEELPVWSLE